MFQESSKDGFAFKAYQGAQMTLLTMDLVQQPPAGAFAGFTLEYTGPNSRRTSIKNLLNFAGTDTITSSVDSPFQAFKWVHFPGSYSQNPVPFGNWDYHATPRFFDGNRKLLPLDAGRTVTVTIPVGDFSKGGLEVGFTRAFLKSQAYASHYGANTKLKPSGKVVTASGVTDGPFAEAKEIVGGFMIIAADDYDEAVAVVKAMPTMNMPGACVEIREMASF